VTLPKYDHLLYIKLFISFRLDYQIQNAWVSGSGHLKPLVFNDSPEI